MQTFSQRIVGAASLRAATFEEVEADAGATGQAMAVVVLSSLAAGLGTAGLGALSLETLVVGTLVGLLQWVAWAVLIYLLGTRVFAEPQTRADVGELLRTTGFASSPGLLRVVGALPGLGWIVLLGTAVWMLAAMIVAVRQALDYRSTGRAIAVCVAGFLLSVVLAVVVGLFFGPVAS